MYEIGHRMWGDQGEVRPSPTSGTLLRAVTDGSGMSTISRAMQNAVHRSGLEVDSGVSTSPFVVGAGVVGFIPKSIASGLGPLPVIGHHDETVRSCVLRRW